MCTRVSRVIWWTKNVYYSWLTKRIGTAYPTLFGRAENGVGGRFPLCSFKYLSVLNIFVFFKTKGMVLVG